MNPRTRGAVATAFPLATHAGIAALRAGGNAIDAAAAAAWALCACEPSASGLGGHTVMLVRFASGRAIVIAGDSCAPAAASCETISEAAQGTGHLSCTVPSTPATLDWAQRRYGLLSREAVMAAAIDIAHEGYRVSPMQQRQARWVREALRASAGGRLFLSEGREPRAGDIVCQPQLARTLERLRDHGSEDFYEGAIASEIARDMRECGGLMTAEDLAAAAQPTETEPLAIRYGDHTIFTCGPPGGGLELLIAFNAMAHVRERGVAPHSDEWRMALAIATSSVFGDRERRALHPQVDIRALLHESHARSLVDAQASQPCVEEAEEPGETTHLCTADGEGNVVALTQSIQSVYGAKVAHPGLGFLYNNYLVTCPRSAHAHALGPRCRPRSNIAPTIALRAEGAWLRPVLAIGAAGSRRILSSILQVASAVLDEGRDLERAISAARIHGLAGRHVWLERSAATPRLLERLQALGRECVVRRDRHFAMGGVQAIRFHDGGRMSAAADPRRDGTARSIP